MPPGCCPMYFGKPSSSEDNLIKSRHTGALIFSWKCLGFLHLRLQMAGVTVIRLLGQLVDFFGRQAQGFTQIPDGAPYHVGSNGTGQGGVLPAPFLMGLQNQIFADTAREIKVDIRDVGHCIVRQETLQRQLVLQRVDVGKPDEVADE